MSDTINKKDLFAMFTFVESSEPMLEDDMYEFDPDPRLHIQVTMDGEFNVVSEDVPGEFLHHQPDKDIYSAMERCYQYHKQMPPQDEQDGVAPR